MKIDPSKIFINDYDYNLPEDKIAYYPLNERDNSKLLIYKNRESEKIGFIIYQII